MKKNLFKKIIAVVLSLLLTCGVIPLTAFANSKDNTNVEATPVKATPVKATPNYESTAADVISFMDFEYNVNADNTITITKYLGSSSAVSIPETIDGKTVVNIGNSVFERNANLKSIIIPNGVINIGKKAFYSSGLTTVIIPDSVTSIGDEAFAQCRNITSVTLSNSLISIGKEAFLYCHLLESITIPNSVKNIGDEAFEYCKLLINIAIPSNVTSIGDDVFGTCDNLVNINVDENNMYYSSSNGILFNKDKTTLIAFPIKNSITEYVIPNTVTSIAEVAFRYCGNLTSVILPENITNIGIYAFANCTALTEIIIPNGLTSISTSVFAYCENLVKVTIPKSVTSISDGVFYNCTKLVIHGEASSYAQVYATKNNIPFVQEGTVDPNPEVDYKYKLINDNTEIEITKYVGINAIIAIPEKINGKPVTSIGTAAFKDCKILNSITIPASVNSIGDNAFQSCKSLESIVIPSGVTKIGPSVFDYCSKLKSVSIPEGVTSIGARAFYACESLMSITMPNNVTSIGDFAFQACKSIKSIIIPFGVERIGKSVFQGCSVLTDVTVPNSVTIIGADAFSFCDSLKTIVIPNSVKSIGERAFGYCKKLTNITLPSSVISIGNTIVDRSESVVSINVDENNEKYSSSEGILFNKDKSILITVPINNPITEYIIPSTVKTISNNAFDHCNFIERVEISDNVTSIGDLAFQSCENIKSIIIPFGVERIGMFAFSTCSSLTSITIPSSVKSIGNRAFSYCKLLTEITIPKGIESIGGGMFSNCTSLTSVTIPNSVTSIGDYAFNSCTALTEITIPSSVTNIGVGAFDNCTALTIHGEASSYAQTYAKENGIPFVVEIPKFGVFLNKSNLTLKETHREQLIAEVKLVEEGSTEVVWKSSDDSIARVDANGTVTAVKTGKATITATTVDGQFSASCSVTVEKLDVKLINEPSKGATATGIKIGDTSDNVISNLMESGAIAENQTVAIVNKDGVKISPDTKLGTGMKIQITDSTGARSLPQSTDYTVIIKGDVNGDGEINVFDTMAIRDHVFGDSQLEGCYYQAAELTDDGVLSIFDSMAIRDHVFGDKTITQ